MNRRKFLGSTAVLASGAAIGASLPVSMKAFSPMAGPDLVVHKATNYFLGVKEAIGHAGGISRFVPGKSSIGILINSAFEIRPALVKPEISLGLLDLLMETNPKEIIFLQAVTPEYWNTAPYNEIKGNWPLDLQQVASNVFPATYNDKDFMILGTIPGAKQLKDIEIVKKFTEVDVFINVPIIKHHSLTLLTGALKNMMGICTRKTNVSFHLGSGTKNDPGFLAECITDINLVRRPDLVVADATELIINNGPAGPGDTIKPDKILVGADPVAVDAYGCTIMGYDPGETPSIINAYEAGLGEMDISRLDILQTNQQE
jgi:uncharacterized protein (DUF362 family)